MTTYHVNDSIRYCDPVATSLVNGTISQCFTQPNGGEEFMVYPGHNELPRLVRLEQVVGLASGEPRALTIKEVRRQARRS